MRNLVEGSSGGDVLVGFGFVAGRESVTGWAVWSQRWGVWAYRRALGGRPSGHVRAGRQPDVR